MIIHSTPENNFISQKVHYHFLHIHIPKKIVVEDQIKKVGQTKHFKKRKRSKHGIEINLGLLFYPKIDPSYGSCSSIAFWSLSRSPSRYPLHPQRWWSKPSWSNGTRDCEPHPSVFTPWHPASHHTQSHSPTGQTIAIFKHILYTH